MADLSVATAEAATPLRRPRLRDGWVLGALVVLGALLLAFVPFTRGDWGTRVCVPAVNAWDASPPPPSAADRAAFAAPLPGPGDPDTVAAVDRVARYEEWRDGPGACRADSRTRLAAAAVALVIGLVLVVVLRRRLRRGPARPPSDDGLGLRP